MEKYDVVIVGAGPAGGACAIALARQNLKVALLEKRSLPGAKACGEGILPPGVHHLRDLGILKYINTDECRPIKGIRYTINNLSADATFSEGLGLGINRLILSKAILNTLKEYPNIKLIETEFNNYTHPLVHFGKAKSQSIKTDFLVGADGLRSTVRKSLSLKLKKPFFKRWAMTGHFAIEPWSPLVEIYLNHHIEAYITPTGPNEINVVLMWAPDDLPPVKGPELFFSLLKYFPDLYNRLKNHSLSHKAHAIGPFQHRPTKLFSSNHAALIGDAAGYIDPLSGEGINLGLYSGRLLAEVIGHNLKTKQALRAADLKHFQEKFLKHAAPHALLTYSLLYLQRQPRIFEKVVKYLDQHPRILRTLMSTSMGNPPRWLKPLELYELISKWQYSAKP